MLNIKKSVNFILCCVVSANVFSDPAKDLQLKYFDEETRIWFLKSAESPTIEELQLYFDKFFLRKHLCYFNGDEWVVNSIVGENPDFNYGKLTPVEICANLKEEDVNEE